MPDPPTDPLSACRRELLELRRRIDEQLESIDVRLSPAARPLPLEAPDSDGEATAPVPVPPSRPGRRELPTAPVPAVTAQVPAAATDEPPGRRRSARGLRRSVLLVAAANVVGVTLLAAAAAGARHGGGDTAGGSAPVASDARAPSVLHGAGTPGPTTSTTSTTAPPAAPDGPAKVSASRPAGAASAPTTTAP